MVLPPAASITSMVSGGGKKEEDTHWDLEFKMFYDTFYGSTKKKREKKERRYTLECETR